MRPRSRSAACLLTAAAAFASSTSGCSWIFTEGPPSNHAMLPYFDCSTSYAPPVLDTIWGGLNLLGAVNAAGQDDDYENREAIMATGLIWAAVSGASAVYGYSKVGQCHSAKEQLMVRSYRPVVPTGYSQPPGYPPAYPQQPGSPPPVYPQQPGSPPPVYPPQPAAPATPPAPPAPPAPPSSSTGRSSAPARAPGALLTAPRPLDLSLRSDLLPR